jgi:Leucine-rich repeat (LRR) protein
MGNTCCGSERRPDTAQGHNRLSKKLSQRKANYAATGIVPLRDARLETLPPFVEELGGKVKTLDCTNNRLAELPSTIEANINLVRLVLARNLLTSLPLEVYTLSNLKVCPHALVFQPYIVLN